MLVVVLIPAYKPTDDFPDFVASLLDRGIRRIVVVDDGSGPAFRARFDRVAGLPGVGLCRHAVNLGKGAALKTGINAALCSYPDLTAVVTCDADGQHAADDVVRVAREAEAHPDALVLGVRGFSDKVPFRSRFGNIVTRHAMHIVVGQRITDSQTGLRGLPYHLLSSLLKISAAGYDFELDMLVSCREKRVPIREVPVQTIYLDGNASSHFNPLTDSMRIYFVLLRFALVSISSTGVDWLLFSLVFFQTGHLVASQAGARLVSMLFNFLVVKQLVFKAHGHGRKQFLQYLALVVFSGSVSLGLIHVLMTYAGWSVVPAKVTAEVALFFFNFLVQRDLIFPERDLGERVEAERQLRAAAAGPAMSIPTEQQR